MQIFKDFDKNKHDIFDCLFVKQPIASMLIEKGVNPNEGVRTAVLTEDLPPAGVRTILVCSKLEPTIPHLDCGCTIGVLEVHSTKQVKDLDLEDWDKLGIQKSHRKKYLNYYMVEFRNPQMVIPMPAYELDKGFHQIAFDKEEIMGYNQYVSLDRKALKKITRKSKLWKRAKK